MAKINETVKQEVNNNDIVQTLLAKIESLEAKQQQLEKKVSEEEKTTFEAAKERNVQPKEYRYKLWWWVPVLNFTTKRKDPTKDLVYEVWWVAYNNHLLVLELEWGKKLEVDAIDFWKSHTWSKMQVALDANTRKPIVPNDKWLITSVPQEYIFTTPEWNEILVNVNAIN